MIIIRRDGDWWECPYCFEKWESEQALQAHLLICKVKQKQDYDAALLDKVDKLIRQPRRKSRK